MITTENYHLGTSSTFRDVTKSVLSEEVSRLRSEKKLERWTEVKKYKEMRIEEIWKEICSKATYVKKSPKSDSCYAIFEETGEVYRYADHWGKFASVNWKLDTIGTDDSVYYCGYTGNWAVKKVSIGVSKLSDFQLIS